MPIDDERKANEGHATKPNRQLSKELKEFYASQNIHVNENGTNSSEDIQQQPFRFVRLNPRHNKDETLRMLNGELQKHQADTTAHQMKEVQPVAWLHEECGFYALPDSFSLAQSECFRTGRIYGMDVSSGAGIAVLLSNQYDKTSTQPHNGVTSGERILDLCCCPGLKLCCIADMTSANSTIIGVDISETRTALCKRIINKYLLDPNTSGLCYTGGSKNNTANRIRLYCQDGTTFGSKYVPPNLIFDSKIAAEEFEHRGKRKRMNKSAKARERKRLRQVVDHDFEQPPPNDGGGNNDSTNAIPNKQLDQTANQQQQSSFKLFDRVLVDAECSTDGSWKHLEQKLKSSKAAASNPLLTDDDQLSELVELQKKLIMSGFRLLKPGGIMVYSTCSLSDAQNEGVVSWFLNQKSESVQLVPVHFPLTTSQLVSEGSIPGTVRFKPNLGGSTADELFGGGFYLAKFKKLAT